VGFPSKGLCQRSNSLRSLLSIPTLTVFRRPSEVGSNDVANRSTICYSGNMPKVIPQRSLRNDNAKIIDEVVNGQSFVVTRNGVEVAEIRPVRHKKSVVVHRDVLLALVGVGPQIDGRAFRQDLDDAMDQYL